MRILTLATFVFLAFVVNVPIVHAECVEDQAAGTYYDSNTGANCTPRSGVDTSTTRRTGVDTSSGSGTNVRLINPLNTGECAPNENCLLNFLNKILDFVIRIGTVVVILMMVYVGYLFVVAQGKEDKIREARNALLWTLIGALVLLGSQAIAKGIEVTVKALSSGG